MLLVVRATTNYIKCVVSDEYMKACETYALVHIYFHQELWRNITRQMIDIDYANIIWVKRVLVYTKNDTVSFFVVNTR